MIKSLKNSLTKSDFEGLFEPRTSQTIAITISVLLTAVCQILCYGAIWYDLNGSIHNRTLMHKLSYLIYWIGFFALPIIQVSEIARYVYGPFSHQVCLFHIIFKNTGKTQILMLLDANIIARYVFIFHLRNPIGVQENFWTIFIAVWIAGFSMILNFAFFILPDRRALNCFTCIGSYPKVPPQTQFGGFEILSLLIHLSVKLKIFLSRANNKFGYLGNPNVN